MKFLMAAIVSFMLIMGCAYVKPKNSAHILETERSLVAGCRSVGVLSETSDAGNPFTFYTTRRMLAKIRKRAAVLGATHIVWLHRTSQSAAAEAFYCPTP